MVTKSFFIAKVSIFSEHSKYFPINKEDPFRRTSDNGHLLTYVKKNVVHDNKITFCFVNLHNHCNFAASKG